MGRIAIFIDGAYLDCILREEFNLARIDYHKLSLSLAKDKEILRTYYYHCPPYQSNPPTAEEKERFGRKQRFFHKLSQLPHYEIRLGRLEFRGYDVDGKPIFQQKRVDILLGVDLTLLSAKHRIEYAALLAGDSDLIPAVRVAKDEGVIIWLYHGKQYHRDLWNLADEREQLTRDLIDSILLPTV